MKIPQKITVSWAITVELPLFNDGIFAIRELARAWSSDNKPSAGGAPLDIDWKQDISKIAKLRYEWLNYGLWMFMADKYIWFNTIFECG